MLSSYCDSLLHNMIMQLIYSMCHHNQHQKSPITNYERYFLEPVRAWCVLASHWIEAILTYMHSLLGLCDLGKISNCNYYYYFFFLHIAIWFAILTLQSSFSSILLIMCSTVWVSLPCWKKTIETITQILIDSIKTWQNSFLFWTLFQ